MNRLFLLCYIVTIILDWCMRTRISTLPYPPKRTIPFRWTSSPYMWLEISTNVFAFVLSYVRLFL